MLIFLIIIPVLVRAAENDTYDPLNHLENYRNRNTTPRTITLSNGAPASEDEARSTMDDDIPNNPYYYIGLSHILHERIPERVVHAKGAGAYGYFEVTHDISHICKASFLSKIGKITPIAVRFSTSSKERGSCDSALEFRGFSVKFYTDQGNFDICGFNTPMYLYKDPINFMGFVHSVRRNPSTHMYDYTSQWDTYTLLPEMLHAVLLLYSGRGLPASYINMPGFGIHTYQVENKHGDIHFIRFHFIPDAGIKNMGREQARNLSCWNPDCMIGDLYTAIGKGKNPSWLVKVQILTKSDVKKEGYQIFDVTRTICEKKYPLHPVGKIILNKNPVNYHAQVEQMACSPGNLVPGINGAPDRIFQARRFAYRHAATHRLGVNFEKIDVNCPFELETFTYVRDGSPPVRSNDFDSPNYILNSFNGHVPCKEKKRRLIKINEYRESNFDQAGELYNGLTTEEQNTLIENLVFELETVPFFMQERAVHLFTIIDVELGYNVAEKLKIVHKKKYNI